ncbi:hypothetical protein FisN_18Hh114 [Fistulifera solaris]|uniref:Uncharacterized protein n=1 Tax=Fistulifera solaris TaxID=1519565 RepID=A0A1Z5JVS6_FISSO|nr:hypothetical protein FisN_18Hh114 [Fistulifera solaris]|eukprot:GAX17908.1 hypothetical protein FisN_18Hh114 [Fistulifera solaris]
MRFVSPLLWLGLVATACSQRTPVCRDLGKGVIDQGCTEDFPTCVYRNGGQVVGGNAGQRCALCINSQQPNHVDQVAPDEGCDDVNRVCVGKRQLAANVEGTACAVCFNSIPTSIDPNDIDDGCPPTTPVCVNDDGESPALWTPGTDCVAKCVDTSLTGPDKGCPRRYPVCTLEDGSDPGSENPGTICSVCSPASCDDQDPCTDDFCDPEGGCFYVDNGSCGNTCNVALDWQCTFPVPFCTQFVPDDEFFACVCDVDTEGSPFCWRDAFCSDRADCSSNDDCGPNEKCASTCCGTNKCLEDCALTDDRLRRKLDGHHHSEKTATGL